MHSELPALSSFSLHKNPTPNQRWKEAKPIVLFFGMFFLIGLLFPIVFSVFPVGLVLGWSMFPLLIFLVGIVVGLGVVLAVRNTSRLLLGGKARQVEALEKQVQAAGSHADAMAQLDALVTANLKLGRPQVAEFYSKQLLAISEKSDSEELAPVHIMQSTSAWVSTPAYHKKINYWMVWLFESRGTLCLTDEFLEYESVRISFRIALHDIIDIGLENHPWWLKPIPMHYIRITYREHGMTDSFFLTPYKMQTDTVFDVNKNVESWYQNLTKALAKAC